MWLLLPLFSCAFAAGVTLGLVTALPGTLTLAAAIALSIASLLTRQRTVRALAVPAVALALGLGSAELAEARAASVLATELPDEAVFFLRVVEGPRPAATTGAWRARAQGGVVPGGDRFDCDALVEVRGLPGARLPMAGDELALRATRRGGIEPLHEFAWDGRRFAARAGIAAVLDPVATPLWAGSRWTPMRSIDHLRLRMERSMLTRLPEREAGVLVAMVTGSRGLLDPEVRDAFAANGAAHVLAVSGSHLTLLCAAVFALLVRVLGRFGAITGRWGTRVAAVAITAPLVGAYVVLTGAPASAARAGVMAVAVLLAELAGRKVAPMHALFASAALLLAWEPLWIADAGFQLSWLATAALLGAGAFGRVDRQVTPRSRSRVRRILCSLRAATEASVAPSLITAPVMFWHFGALPLLGPLTNLTVVPPLAVIGLPAGALGGLAASLGLWPLDTIALFVARWATWLSLQIGAAAGGVLELPLVWGRPSLAGLLAWSLAGLAGFAVARPLSRAFLVPLVAGVTLALLVDAPARLGDIDGIEVRAIPVGQGDCTLLRLRGGTTLLVDAGGSGRRPEQTGRYAVLPWLRGVGVDRVDVVVVSHSDADHAAGLVSLLPSLRPRAVWIAEAARGDGHVRAVVAAAEQAGSPVWFVPAGVYRAEQGGLLVELDAPRAGASDNDASLALRVCADGRCVLLAGDAEHPREAELWLRDRVRADVLKLSHHGSRTSSSDIFLDAVRPQLALLHVGRHNRFGFPHGEVVARLERRGIGVLRTDGGQSVGVAITGASITPLRSARPRVWRGPAAGLMWRSSFLQEPLGVVLGSAVEGDGAEEVHDHAQHDQ